jgi:hypothetical protein
MSIKKLTILNITMNDLDKKFCIIPFNSFSISPRGIIRPCCVVYSNSTANKLPNVKTLTSDIPWPVESIQNLRKKMIGPDVEKNTPECRWCWTSENSGTESMREKSNKFWLERLGEAGFAELIKNPTLNTLDLQFGHLCNLSCMMCNASLSSHMHSTKIKLAEITTDEKQRASYKYDVDYLKDNLDWTKDPASYQKVLDLCESITEIKISGGEPLFNPRFKHFLRYLIEKEKPLYRLNLTTNGTVCDEEIIELINRVPHVTIKISLESVGHEDEFIRWPTNWEKKDSIIKQFVAGIKKNEYLQIQLSSCIQSLNLFSIHKINEYADTLNYNFFIQSQSVLASDMAALWHSDPEYVKEYLETPAANKEEFATVKNYAIRTMSYKDKKTKEQVLYFMDMAKVQGKSLAEHFPIYWKYHEKYLYKTIS